MLRICDNRRYCKYSKFLVQHLIAMALIKCCAEFGRNIYTKELVSGPICELTISAV